MELTQEMITWIAVFIATNLSAVVIAVLSWIKAAKMLPKELKGSDLDNKIKEATLAEQLDELATKAADKAIQSQTRLDKLEKERAAEKETTDKEKRERDALIKEQTDLINKLNTRLELLNGIDETSAQTQERLGKLETDSSDLQKKVSDQDEIIKSQAIIINKQNVRLDMQEKKMLAQEEEIILLKCELNNSQMYNQALIAQMKEGNIIPIELESIFPEDCKESLEIKKKLKAKRSAKKQVPPQ